MRKICFMPLHIALYQPEIPANTGNIARTCAGTHTSLHLIRPLGFSTDDKMLKRAGLDYWAHVDIHYHDDLEAFIAHTEAQNGKVFLIETYSDVPFSEHDFSNQATAHAFTVRIQFFRDFCAAGNSLVLIVLRFNLFAQLPPAFGTFTFSGFIPCIVGTSTDA